MTVSPFLSKKKNAPVRKIPLQDIMDRFLSAKRTERRSPKTLKTYREEFMRFQRWLDSTGLKEINSSTIQAYITHLTYEKVKWDDHPTNPNGPVGLSPRTVNNTIRNLKSLFNWATTEKYYTESPVQNLKYQTQDDEHFEVFSDEQVLKLLNEPHRKTFTGYRDYVMMLVLLDTGMRIGELTSLKISDIDFQLNQIVIPGPVTKTKQTRVAPISKITSHELRELIAYCNLEEGEYVWITQFRQRYMADTFSKMLKNYGRKAGITNVRISPHTFRHYFATKFLLNGGDPVALQRTVQCFH